MTEVITDGEGVRLVKAATSSPSNIGAHAGQVAGNTADLWLVEHGIESISLNPDSVLAMTKLILEVEGNSNARMG